MAAEHSGDPDTGISYNEAPTAIQRLLDKLQKRPRQGGMMNVLGKDESDYMAERSIASLSAKLNDLIQLAYKTQYPKAVLQSSWRKWKKPAVTFKGKIDNKLRKSGWNLEDKRQVRIGLSQKLDDLIQFQGDPRPRNKLGEFSGQAEGGPDPNAMYKTYTVAPQTPGIAPNKQSSGLAEGGALALVGGAAGAAGGHGYKSLAAWVKRASKARK